MAASNKPAPTSSRAASNGKSKPVIEKPAKTSSPEKKPIKYEDKSAGQPKLLPVFNSIKELLKPYAKGTMKVREERAGLYTLVSERTMEVKGKRRDELYFAGIIFQKGYVGFYFMPVENSDDYAKVFNPELLRLLKGKSCFHIKKNDPSIIESVRDALKSGYNIYKQNGWT